MPSTYRKPGLNLTTNNYSNNTNQFKSISSNTEASFEASWNIDISQTGDIWFLCYLSLIPYQNRPIKIDHTAITFNGLAPGKFFFTEGLNAGFISKNSSSADIIFQINARSSYTTYNLYNSIFTIGIYPIAYPGCVLFGMLDSPNDYIDSPFSRFSASARKHLNFFILEAVSDYTDFGRGWSYFTYDNSILELNNNTFQTTLTFDKDCLSNDAGYTGKTRYVLTYVKGTFSSTYISSFNTHIPKSDYDTTLGDYKRWIAAWGYDYLDEDITDYDMFLKRVKDLGLNKVMLDDATFVPTVSLKWDA